MNKYIGTKLVNAKPMTRLEYNQFRGWTLPENENGDDNGFLIEYVDGGNANTAEYNGYVSWSPFDVFNKAYRKTDGLSFGIALEALKKGLKIARKGWNGKGMFIHYVPENNYPAQTQADKSHYTSGIVPCAGYMAIKSVDETSTPWVISQSDALADDWQVID
jgi:hypothetical protein